MLHKRGLQWDPEEDADEYPKLHKKSYLWYGSSRLSKLMKNKLVVSISYFLSVLIVYQYFRLRSQVPYENQSEIHQNPLYIIPEYPKVVPKVEEKFQQYRYPANFMVLPNAPYRHIRKNPDLRVTQLVYLDSVRQKLEKSREDADNTPPMFDFHWMDWVDMSDLEPLIVEKPNCFVAGVLGSNVRTEWPDCIDVNNEDPDGLNFYFDKPALHYEAENRLLLRAKTYLYTVAPIPKKLIFIAGELAFVVKTKDAVGLNDNGLLQNFITSRLEDHKDIMLTEDHIKELPITAKAIVDLISAELGRDLNSFNTPASQYAEVSMEDFEMIVKKIKKTKLASQAAREGRPHFHDVMVKGANDNFKDAYDWRFFQKTLDQQRHRAALHYTVRAWLSFCTNLGFTSWIDEDSLVSWSVNGMILPWEKTIKFKMASKEFLKLATYNYSLIVDDPSEGHGTYLLDLSPYFMERARLNDPRKSPDTVDARFIDTKTGVYVEVNGLMLSKATIPDEVLKEFGGGSALEIVNSADGKFYHLQDILPVKKTLLEGKLSNVPGNALKLISQKNYHTVNSKEHDNYKYQDHLKLWISKSKCNYVPQEDINIFENGGSTFIGACHDLKIWDEFNLTSGITSFRKKEIVATEQILIAAKDQFKPLYPDYWLLQRIEKLHEEYGYILS